MHIDSNYWFGSEASLLDLIKLDKQGFLTPSAPAEDTGPRLLSKEGNVGVITVRGSLINGTRGYAHYVTSYNEVRDAVVEAAKDPGLGAILLDISSGGGAVSGVNDTAELIAEVDSKVKPVYAHTDGDMASAAYWLGSSARKIYNTSTAELGSVGIIAVHMNYSKAMEEMGIVPTVMRSGKYKALGHPMEPLTEAAKAEIQGQLDYLYGIFSEHVASRRGMPLAQFNSKAGEGRVFIGQQAVDVGLSDGLLSFDAVLGKVQSAADKRTSPRNPAQFGVPNKNFTGDSGGGIAFSEKPAQSGSSNLPETSMSTKKPLTAQEIAALGEGAGAAGATNELPEPTAGTQAPEPTAPEANANPAAEPAQPDAVAAQAAVNAYLTKQLAEAQASIVKLNVDLSAAKSQAEKAEASLGAMRPVVQASVARLRVALALPEAAASADDQVLLAEHNSLRAQFESKFKAGGVAAVSAAPEDKKTIQADDPIRQARLKAARISQ